MLKNILCALAALVILSAPARAEELPAEAPAAAAQEEGFGGGTMSVTPVEDCFSKIGPKEAIVVRRDFPFPYQECLRRLELREKEKAKEEKADKDKDGDKDKEKDKASSEGE